MAKYSGITILRNWCLITIIMLLLISTTAINNIKVEARDYEELELDMVTCYLTTGNPEFFKKFLYPVKSATEVYGRLHSSSAVCAPVVPPHHHPTPALAAPSPPPRGYAVVALQWPMGLCKTTKCNKNDRPKKFTLHGVWPKKADGTSSINCKPTYDNWSYNQLKKIENDLNKVWPSFEWETNKDFWQHEWDEHGTCSGLRFFDYFDRSLKLSREWRGKVLGALEKNGIRPSSSTNIDHPKVKSYYDVISNKLNLIPRIKCASALGTRYLVEIHLCATFDLNNIKNCSQQESRYNYIGCGDYGRRSKTWALFYLDHQQGLAFKDFY